MFVCGHVRSARVASRKGWFRLGDGIGVIVQSRCVCEVLCKRILVKEGIGEEGDADITKYVTESRISTRATGFLLVHFIRDPLDAR